MSISAALQAEIAAASFRHSIPSALIAAIVMTESGGDVHAWRVEPHYRYLVDFATGAPFRTLASAERASEVAPSDFAHPAYSSRDTEWWGQQASWGPMQVMGAVARELGFRQPFPALCGHVYGVDVGAQHLARLRDRFFARHGWQGVAAAYNGGSPRYAAPGVLEPALQRYVDKVAMHRGFDF